MINVCNQPHENEMSNVSTRTLPIALALIGEIIISTSIYAFEFAPNGNLGLTSFGILIGLIVIIPAIAVYYWERSNYYDQQVYYWQNR